jgi:hypothetical protein
VRFDPLPTEDEVAEVLAGLPPRLPDETLGDWLARAKQPRRGVVVPFRRFRFTPLAEIRLKAAAGGVEQYSLPEQPIETPDQEFRLTVTPAEDGLQIRVETLGSAIEDYAGRYIGIAGGDDRANPVLKIRLDDEGESTEVVEDSEEVRKVLCVNPVFGLIEPDDA